MAPVPSATCLRRPCLTNDLIELTVIELTPTGGVNVSVVPVELKVQVVVVPVVVQFPAALATGDATAAGARTRARAARWPTACRLLRPRTLCGRQGC